MEIFPGDADVSCCRIAAAAASSHVVMQANEITAAADCVTGCVCCVQRGGLQQRTVSRV